MKVKIKTGFRIGAFNLKQSVQSIIVTLIIFAAFFCPMGASVIALNVGFGKMSLFRLFIFGSAFLALIYKIAGAKNVKLWNKGNSYSIKFFLFWFLYANVTIIWSRDIQSFIRELYFLGIGILITILLNDICRFGDSAKILRALNCGFFIQGLIGVYEYITLDYRYLDDINKAIYSSQRLRYPVAMLSNPNDFATAMYIGAAISFFLLLDKNIHILKRVAYIVMFATYLWLIVAGSSRATQIGLVIAIVLFTFMYLENKLRYLVISGTILLSPIVISFLRLSINLEYYQTKGESFSVRVNLIKNGLLFLKRTVGFGVGNGQIEYWMEHYSRYEIGSFRNMHNWWAEILSGYGMIVFCGFVIFYIGIINNYYKIYKSKSEYGKHMLAMAASLVGLFIVLVSSSSNMNNEYMWLFWAICILMQRDRYLLREKEERKIVSLEK